MLDEAKYAKFHIQSICTGNFSENAKKNQYMQETFRKISQKK